MIIYVIVICYSCAIKRPAMYEIFDVADMAKIQCEITIAPPFPSSRRNSSENHYDNVTPLRHVTSRSGGGTLSQSIQTKSVITIVTARQTRSQAGFSGGGGGPGDVGSGRMPGSDPVSMNF